MVVFSCIVVSLFSYHIVAFSIWFQFRFDTCKSHSVKVVFAIPIGIQFCLPDETICRSKHKNISLFSQYRRKKNSNAFFCLLLKYLEVFSDFWTKKSIFSPQNLFETEPQTKNKWICSFYKCGSFMNVRPFVLIYFVSSPSANYA